MPVAAPRPVRNPYLAEKRAGMRAQEEAGPPKGSTTCLYCRTPCDADLFAREPVWACAGCGEAAAHVSCFHAAHAVPHDGDGCAHPDVGAQAVEAARATIVRMRCLAVMPGAPTPV